MSDGGFNTFNAMMSGGKPSQPAMEYFNNQYQQLVNTAQVLGNTAVSQIYQLGINTYQNVMQSRPWEIAEALIRQTVHLFDNDVIRPLQSLAELQTAKPIMQRWVMACPEVRELYLQQRLDGYSNTYEDAQPGVASGAAHYDYRRAMSDMVVVGEDDWSATQYHEKLAQDDNDLSFAEKKDVLISWDAVRGLLTGQLYDPTSIFNSKL